MYFFNYTTATAVMPPHGLNQTLSADVNIASLQPHVGERGISLSHQENAQSDTKETNQQSSTNTEIKQQKDNNAGNNKESETGRNKTVTTAKATPT